MLIDKVLIIIRGLSNNGKTTLAHQLTQFIQSQQLTAYAVAADQFPNLYTENGYDKSKQKDSHSWCFAQVEKKLSEGVNRVVVHNTFVEERYYLPYVKLAETYGYAVQIVHAEKLILPDGKIPDNGHNVPPEILSSMASRWEPVNKPTPKTPSLKEVKESILRARSLLELPETKIIVDRDNTLVRTLSGETFPENPSDFVLTELAEFLSELSHKPISVATNQRGLSTGHKTADEVTREMNFIGDLLKKENIEFGFAAIASGYNSKEGYLFNPADGKLWNKTFNFRADKPGYGMIARLSGYTPFIYFGDSPNDWEAVTAFQKSFDIPCAYIPVECFELI